MYNITYFSKLCNMILMAFLDAHKYPYLYFSFIHIYIALKTYLLYNRLFLFINKGLVPAMIMAHLTTSVLTSCRLRKGRLSLVVISWISKPVLGCMSVEGGITMTWGTFKWPIGWKMRLPSYWYLDCRQMARHLEREMRNEFILALTYSIWHFQVPEFTNWIIAESNTRDTFTGVDLSKRPFHIISWGLRPRQQRSCMCLVSLRAWRHLLWQHLGRRIQWQPWRQMPRFELCRVNNQDSLDIYSASQVILADSVLNLHPEV
jgi:hypothetical protein